MTTTPTVWKSEFTVNSGATVGLQSDPVTVGLADGRFLTVWVDTTNNIDDDPGTDIIGRIYDAQGQAAGSAFQVNLTAFSDNEGDPAIAALPRIPPPDRAARNGRRSTFADFVRR